MEATTVRTTVPFRLPWVGTVAPARTFSVFQRLGSFTHVPSTLLPPFSLAVSSAQCETTNSSTEFPDVSFIPEHSSCNRVPQVIHTSHASPPHNSFSRLRVRRLLLHPPNQRLRSPPAPREWPHGLRNAAGTPIRS